MPTAEQIDIVQTVASFAERSRTHYADTKELTNSGGITCVTMRVPVALLNRIRDLEQAFTQDVKTSSSTQRQSAQPFDYQTAANLLAGKCSRVSDDLIGSFVASARAAHDDRTTLEQDLRELRSLVSAREAEIDLLKGLLHDVEKAGRETAEGLLLWALWHHQGSGSPVGQPIRRYLGMGQHDAMLVEQVQHATDVVGQIMSPAAASEIKSHDGPGADVAGAERGL